MKILSLNVWGGLVHGPLLAYLAAADADVCCLQEVSRAPAARSDWLTYRDGDHVLQQRANLYREIKAALPAHEAFFCPTARGALLDGDRPCPQEFGIATFVRETIPVLGQVQDFVHGAFSADGFGPHPRARNAHVLRLHDYGRGAAVTVAHLHGLRDPAGKGDTPARTAQAERLVDLLDRVRRPGDALVVCGDFNVLPDSISFDILGRIGLTDLVTGRGFTDTRTSHYGKSGRYADYLLVNAETPVAGFEVVAEPEVSDHRPLLLTIA
ncbi:endonuclease/exonuclease/phosphatase family protein [Rhizobium sp. TRM95111]|uniref:endonuclease/exonuclease/phosphatase family protein n=1 Tax=Rhizobium alarense TaxID=2846851 RepID=UPI001F28FBB1|nr:endonuclease/exonuclease/phosphatase family protein [Rhizobium alarense]MCF3642106.1 endonuclease/exonuclease/phosphatase family protein [Rhizobium alarense]